MYCIVETNKKRSRVVLCNVFTDGKYFNSEWMLRSYAIDSCCLLSSQKMALIKVFVSILEQIFACWC